MTSSAPPLPAPPRPPLLDGLVALLLVGSLFRTVVGAARHPHQRLMSKLADVFVAVGELIDQVADNGQVAVDGDPSGSKAHLGLVVGELFLDERDRLARQVLYKQIASVLLNVALVTGGGDAKGTERVVA